MSEGSGEFELLGQNGDETRIITHCSSGFIGSIPGTPRHAELRDSYFVVQLEDEQIEILFRLDTLSTSVDPGPLVETVANAYVSTAAEPPVRSVTPLRPLARGAASGASATYQRRGVDTSAMESLSVTVKPGIITQALYSIVRFVREEITPVQWANFRTALASDQSWDDTPPPVTPTPLWPDSEFAAPGIALELLPKAWEEAQAKARDFADVSSDEVRSATDILLQFAVSDDPPTFPLPKYVLDLGARQVAMRADPRVAEVMLRNFYEIRTTHDLRAWCWQCIWALGNRFR